MSFLILVMLASLRAYPQESADLEWKFRSLVNDWTSNGALPWFLGREDDATVRKYLISHLPAALDDYKQREDGMPNVTWGNEARVAGEFKIAEAAPALARRIDMQTYPLSGGSQAYNFHERAADNALVRIGPPSVPYVIEVLKHSNYLRREIAVHILRNISTEEAWRAIEAALPGETNVHVRARIEDALASRR